MQAGVSNLDLAQHRLKGLFASAGNLFKTSFAIFAASFPPHTDVRTIARNRAEAMYEAFLKLKDPPFGTAAAVSYAIDTHIPLIISDVTQIHIAYRQKLTPEFQKKFPATLTDSLGVTKNLWAKDGPYTNLRRLLRKGGPFASSVRYVSSQMQRCLKDPKSEATIACLLRMNMLGSYSHSNVIANLDTRVRVYKSKATDLIRVFEEERLVRNSHDYFYATAEYVLAASKLMPSLWGWVVQHQNYKQFDCVVIKATDLMRKKCKPPRVVQIVAPRAWNAKASLHGLIAASLTRKKLNTAALKENNTVLAAVYKQSVLSEKRRGYAYNAVKIVGPEILGIEECATDNDQRSFCQRLPPAILARLQTYCHGQITQQSVVAGVLSKDAAEAQAHAVASRSGFEEAHLFVCICCGTWRPKTSATNRGTVGVQLHPKVDRPWKYRCNLCKSTWGIRAIDMVGKVLQVKLKIDTASQLLCLCCMCGVPAVNPTFKGTYPYCSSCAVKGSTKTCFFCRREDKGEFKKFVATRHGKPQVFLACAKHMPTMKGLQSVSIDKIAQCVRKAQSLYSRRQRTNTRRWNVIS